MAKTDTREILLSRNRKRTVTYKTDPDRELNFVVRGTSIAMSVERDERGSRTVEKQTGRVFVVLN